MYNYVTLDEYGVVVGVSTLSSAVTAPNMLLVPNATMALLGKVYNKATGEFE